MEVAARRGAGLQAADMDGADASSALRDKPLQRVHPSSYVPQIISRLRIRNLLTYEDSGWIELGRRTLIVGPNGSGKTNMIRALRLLRAAVGLEGGIQETELRNYLHDLGKSSAGIDLEISLWGA